MGSEILGKETGDYSVDSGEEKTVQAVRILTDIWKGSGVFS